MNFETAINEANIKLKRNKISSSSIDSEILMSEVLNKTREYVILHLNQELKRDKYLSFQKMVDERSKGKPIAYIIRKKSFWKNEFYLNEKVLIPRPDTEMMIEEILKIFKNKARMNILDIGVGSGCILLSILEEKINCIGTGIDISKEAINVSLINANKLGLSNRVKLFKTDVDNFRFGKYDLIISNPPYIKKLDLKYLEKDIIYFEPKLALDGGLAGISEIRKIINKSSELIKKNGKLFIEIAFDQKYVVKKLLKEKGFYINAVVKDLANNDRCIISTKL